MKKAPARGRLAYQQSDLAWMRLEGIEPFPAVALRFPQPLLAGAAARPTHEALQAWPEPQRKIWELLSGALELGKGQPPYVRREIRQLIAWLRRAWIAHQAGRRDLSRLCLSEALHQHKLIFLDEPLTRYAQALETDQRRARNGLLAHGKSADWTTKIEAALRADPIASNRSLAARLGCGETTIRRYRKKS